MEKAQTWSKLAWKWAWRNRKSIIATLFALVTLMRWAFGDIKAEELVKIFTLGLF